MFTRIDGKKHTDKEEETDKDTEFHLSDAYLDQAIDAYLKGFESDSRDTYPGINAVTLMEIKRESRPKKIRSHSCSKIFSPEKDCNGKT